MLFEVLRFDLAGLMAEPPVERVRDVCPGGTLRRPEDFCKVEPALATHRKRARLKAGG